MYQYFYHDVYCGSMVSSCFPYVWFLVGYFQEGWLVGPWSSLRHLPYITHYIHAQATRAPLHHLHNLICDLNANTTILLSQQRGIWESFLSKNLYQLFPPVDISCTDKQTQSLSMYKTWPNQMLFLMHISHLFKYKGPSTDAKHLTTLTKTQQGFQVNASPMINRSPNGECSNMVYQC